MERTAPTAHPPARQLREAPALWLAGLVTRVAEAPVATRVVYGAAAVAGAGFALLAALRHAAFSSHRYDLGNLTQAVWSTAHGRPLEMTAGDGEQILRLASHVEPTLLLFAPLWWLWPSPTMLVAVQGVALALGALPVFWLARKHIGSPPAAVNFALAYLLYLPVQYNALNDFHPVTLAIPLLLFAVWFLDEQRLVPFAVTAVLAAGTKEEVGLALVGLGLWYAVARRRTRAGLAVAVLAAGWTAVAVLVVIPHFAGDHSPFFDRYERVGGSPAGILEMLVSDPGVAVDEMTTRRDLLYVAALLGPLLGLWSLAPGIMVATVPELALNLLSSFWSQTSMRYQYVAPIVPFVFAASIFGAARLRTWARPVSMLVLAVAGLAMAVLGPQRLWHDFAVDALSSTPRAEAAREAVAIVPPGAAVSASNRLGAHLSERRTVYSFPVVREAAWIVVDRRDPWMPLAGERDAPGRYGAALASLRRSASWRLVFRRAGIAVYRRVAPGGPATFDAEQATR